MHGHLLLLGALLAPIVAHRILAGSFERAGLNITHTLRHLRGAAAIVVFCMASAAGSG